MTRGHGTPLMVSVMHCKALASNNHLSHKQIVISPGSTPASVPYLAIGWRITNRYRFRDTTLAS